MVISLRTGMQKERDALLNKLVAIQYERNDVAFGRNKFRVKGDTVEIFPVYSSENAIRVEFFGDEIDRISEKRGESIEKRINGSFTRDYGAGGSLSQ
jgi:excinuclease ABC subunit B